MTAVAEPPVLDQPTGQPRKRWPYVGMGGVFILASAVLFATRSPAPSSVDEKFLYVHDGTYQAWLSMDGQHDGKVISDTGPTFVGGCVNGTAMSEGDYVGLKPEPCTLSPVNLPDAPATVSGMVSYIEQQGGTDPNRVGKEIGALAEFYYLKPAAREALFDAAGHIAGLSVGLTAVTNNGTATMGISWGAGSERGTLLYNPKTLAYLGGPRVSGGEQRAIEQTVVDNVGDTY